MPLNGDLGRETKIADVEKAIASRWHRKDPEFYIGGLKRQSAGYFAGFSVLRVNSEWIRDNLDVTFGSGGHGLVHTFIPLTEIWIDDTEEAMAPLVLHEAVEFHHMLEEGLDYEPAHEKAEKAVQGSHVTEENLEELICKHCPERMKMVEEERFRDSMAMPARVPPIR